MTWNYFFLFVCQSILKYDLVFTRVPLFCILETQFITYMYIRCCVSFEYALIAGVDFVFRQFSSNRTPSEKDVVM